VYSVRTLFVPQVFYKESTASKCSLLQKGKSWNGNPKHLSVGYLPCSKEWLLLHQPRLSNWVAVPVNGIQREVANLAAEQVSAIGGMRIAEHSSAPSEEWVEQALEETEVELNEN
jgi:hypothetical protein